MKKILSNHQIFAELFHDRTNKFYGKNFQDSFMSIINNNKPELPIYLLKININVIKDKNIRV